jgi:DNA sulfur modification protein DndE
MATGRIFSAPEHKDLIISLSRRLNFSGGGRDYIIGRIAIARSLIFPELDYDKSKLRSGSGGKEYHRSALLGDDLKDSMFKALIAQRHEQNFDDEEEFSRVVKYHLDRGLDLIANEIQNRDIWDYLADLLKNGIQQASLPGQETMTDSGFSNILRIIFGEDLSTNTQMIIEFNRHQNTHLGVAGGTSSGKTQFVLDILYQIRNNSYNKVNMIFIDYKGDVSKNERFVNATNSRVIDIVRTPLPFNPFWIANAQDEKNVKMEIKHFEEMIADIEKRIGTIQKGAIYDAIFEAFQNVKDSENPVPDAYDIKESLENLYIREGRSEDSAIEIFKDLTKLEIFAKKTDKNNLRTLYNHSLIFDMSSIKSQKNLIVFFILEYLKRELMELPEQTMYGDIRELRTVIVIDEAHYFLRDKKMCSILDEILRIIRSKGVSIFLLTQSPDDFSQTEDFLLNLEFIITLNSKINTSKFLQKAFSIAPQEAKELVIDIGNLKTGTGYIKDFESGRPVKLELSQFWKRG